MDYILKDPTILQDPPHFQGRPSILVIIIKILIFNIKFLFQNIYLKKLQNILVELQRKRRCISSIVYIALVSYPHNNDDICFYSLSVCDSSLPSYKDFMISILPIHTCVAFSVV